MRIRLPQAKNRIDPKLVARFWPPALETFLVGTLRSLQITCLLSGLVAILAYFQTWQGSDARWLPFALFAVHLLSFYRGLWLEENFRPSHWRVGLSELLALFCAIWLLLLLFNPSKLSSQEFLIDFVLAVAGWQLGRTWVRYYFYLFLQPDELPEAEGGISDLPNRGRPPYTHFAAYKEIKQYWYWLLAGQGLVLLLALLVKASRKDSLSSTELAQSVMLLTTAHLFLGIPLMAWARLRYLRTGWQLNRLKEPPRLLPRWNFYTLALVLAAFLPSLLIGAVAFSDALPFTHISVQLPALPTLDQPVRSVPQQTPGAEGEQRPPSWDIIGFVALLGMLMAALLVVGIVLYGVYLLLKAGLAGPRWQKLNLKEIWLDFWEWLRDLFRGRAELDLTKTPHPKPERLNLVNLFRRERLPGDPRGQVQFHYRRMSQRAERAGLPRRTGQTPEEYALYLEPTLTEPALTGDLSGLTGLYEEARYSAHPIAEGQASEARQCSERLAIYFRRKARRSHL